MNDEINETNSTVVFENKVDEIAYNTGVIANTDLFILAIIVVSIVCYLLWKSLDNFLSY